LQEHGVIIPYGEKAIWSAAIEGEGWSNDLTLIKVATNKIWLNPTQRPNDFEGNIVVAEVKSLESKEESAVKTAGLEGKSQDKDASFNSKERSQSAEGSRDDNPLLEKVEYKSLEPLPQDSSTTVEDDLDLLAFLPSINEENGKESEAEGSTTDEVDKNIAESKNIKPEIRPKIKGIETDQVTHFFEWLQDGIQKERLKTNQAKARIHTVDEGVILITPGIFQDFAKTKDEGNDDWTAIQQKVLKKNWHVRNDKGLNMVKYQVKGHNKQTTMNAVLFKDVSKVFGGKEPPDSNPHLTKMD